MPRIQRLIPDDSALHVACRGNNKQVILCSDNDKLKYYTLLHDLKGENGIDIFNYCLMDNHVHLVLFPKPGNTLSKFMKQVNLSYALYFRKQYDYVGHLWQDRFKSCIVGNDSYLLQCGKYVELNPVRAHMVECPGDYRFSSYAFYAYGKADSFVTPNPAYIDLGDSQLSKQRTYIDFVLDFNMINSRVLAKQAYVGPISFGHKLQDIYGISNRSGKRGRPPKLNK